MNYLIVGAVGLVIGIINLLLLKLVKKIEKLDFFPDKSMHKYKSFWVVLLGMIPIGMYFMWLFGEWNYALGAYLLLSAYLLPLTVTDIRYKLIPDTFHVFYGICFILFKIFMGTWYDVLNGVFGAGVVLIIMGLIYLVKKDQFGLGDVKTLCVIAFVVGIPSIVYIFFRALVVAAIYSVIQLLRKKAGLKTEYPLIPFMLIGVLI